jgi:hypothetical protein
MFICLLGAAAVTTMYGQASREARIGENYILLDKGHHNNDTVSVRRDGDELYFQYETTPHINGFTVLGEGIGGVVAAHRVSFSDSQFELTMEVKVSIAELEQASREERPPNFEIVQSPSGQLRFRGYSGETVTAG